MLRWVGLGWVGLVCVVEGNETTMTDDAERLANMGLP
jgi:hypothetical protein